MLPLSSSSDVSDCAQELWEDDSGKTSGTFDVGTRMTKLNEDVLRRANAQFEMCFKKEPTRDDWTKGSKVTVLQFGCLCGAAHSIV